jgi:type IV/VI secretion system ImpK/VasF family protein
MKLLDLYEDLFQYICRLNRASKAEGQLEYARVRSEIETILSEITRNASSDVRLLNQVKKLELPIVFFVDNVLCTSRLKFASMWAEDRMAVRRHNELAGDERFFDFLEQDLTDTSEEAAERLAVFYVCFGLGFMGMYQGRPDQIRKYVEQIFPRIRQWMDVDPKTKISEEAYRCTDTRVLTEPPSNKIVLVALVFVFLALASLAIYYGLYASASRQLSASIDQINTQAAAPK